MALVGVELQTLVSEPDALTTRPPPYVVLATAKRELSKIAKSTEVNKKDGLKRGVKQR